MRYKYLLVSYKENGTHYWGYGGSEDYSSECEVTKCNDVEGVINKISSLEASECEGIGYWDHRLFTNETAFKDAEDNDVPLEWLLEANRRTREELERRKTAKQQKAEFAERARKLQEEQDELAEYERLRKKYDNFNLVK